MSAAEEHQATYNAAMAEARANFSAISKAEQRECMEYLRRRARANPVGATHYEVAAMEYLYQQLVLH